MAWLDCYYNPYSTMKKYEQQPSKPVSEQVDKDSLGQNDAWPGEKLIVPPKKIDGENGETTIVPVVR